MSLSQLISKIRKAPGGQVDEEVEMNDKNGEKAESEGSDYESESSEGSQSAGSISVSSTRSVSSDEE